MNASRALEIVAGLAAGTFLALLVWEDFIRREAFHTSGLLAVYDSTSVVVLACVITLGARRC